MRSVHLLLLFISSGTINKFRTIVLEGSQPVSDLCTRRKHSGITPRQLTLGSGCWTALERSLIPGDLLFTFGDVVKNIAVDGLIGVLLRLVGPPGTGFSEPVNRFSALVILKIALLSNVAIPGVLLEVLAALALLVLVLLVLDVPFRALPRMD